MVILNLFDAVCTTLRTFEALKHRTGPNHAISIADALATYPKAPVLLAWGVTGSRDGADQELIAQLQAQSRNLLCLGHSQNGAPLHALASIPSAKPHPYTTYTLSDLRPRLERNELRALHNYAENKAEFMTLETLELRIEQETGLERKTLAKVLGLVKAKGGTHLDLRDLAA